MRHPIRPTCLGRDTSPIEIVTDLESYDDGLHHHRSKREQQQTLGKKRCPRSSADRLQAGSYLHSEGASFQFLATVNPDSDKISISSENAIRESLPEIMNWLGAHNFSMVLHEQHVSVGRRTFVPKAVDRIGHTSNQNRRPQQSESDALLYVSEPAN